MKRTHRIEVGSLTRDLPIREIKPGLSVALFNMIEDPVLTEEAGQKLSNRVPRGTYALLMPDGKALSLLHVMGRCTGLPIYVARKEIKPYMEEPIVTESVTSITTGRVQHLHLANNAVEALRGKNVVIVDDVISSGSTLDGVRALLHRIGANVHGVMAVLTEGDARTDVISLGHIPLFFDW